MKKRQIPALDPKRIAALSRERRRLERQLRRQGVDLVRHAPPGSLVLLQAPDRKPRIFLTLAGLRELARRLAGTKKADFGYRFSVERVKVALAPKNFDCGREK